MRDWLVYRGQDTRKFKVPYFPSITIPQSIMNLSRKIWRILAEITKISLGLGGALVFSCKALEVVSQTLMGEALAWCCPLQASSPHYLAKELKNKTSLELARSG